jgi:hypothetical protein
MEPHRETLPDLIAILVTLAGEFEGVRRVERDLSPLPPAERRAFDRLMETMRERGFNTLRRIGRKL